MFRWEIKNVVERQRISEEEDLKNIEFTKNRLEEMNNPIINREFNIGEFLRESVNDIYYDGNVVSGIIMQPHKSFFYRGENQDYPSTKPSIYRKFLTAEFSNNKEKKIVEYFVHLLKIEEFAFIIFKLIPVQQHETFHFDFPNSGLNVLYDCLAQHYGFETEWLDITSDFNIALFFACCKLDENNQWKSLSRKEIASNYKYGYIYSTDKSYLFNYYDVHTCNPPIMPIGYQPFNRCSMQSGYGIKMSEKNDLNTHQSFKKYSFEHTEKMCKEIFDKMEGGALIYPNESILELQSYFDVIKKSNSFSRDAFESVFNNTYKNTDYIKTKDEILELLCKYNYIITDNSPVTVPVEKFKSINERFENYNLVKAYSITPATRPLYRPI